MYCIYHLYMHQPRGEGVFFRVKPVPMPAPSKSAPIDVPVLCVVKKGGKRKLPVCECRTNPSIHPSTCAPIRCDPKTIKENSKGAASKCVRDLTYNKGKKKETERER